MCVNVILARIDILLSLSLQIEEERRETGRMKAEIDRLRSQLQRERVSCRGNKNFMISLTKINYT